MSEMILKHSIGHDVRITDDSCFHGFPIGSIVSIIGHYDWGNGFYSYEGVCEDGDQMLFDDDDCEGIV